MAVTLVFQWRLLFFGSTRDLSILKADGKEQWCKDAGVREELLVEGARR